VTRPTFTIADKIAPHWTTLVLLGGLALACGSSTRASTPDAADEGGAVTPPPLDGHENPPPPLPASKKCDGRIAIYLRGSPSDAFGQVDLELGALTAKAATRVTVHDVFTGRVNVASDRRWRLAVLEVPPDAGRVEARLPILGGALDCIPFDRCTGPLRLHLDLELVSPTLCHAVIDLDLWRSITAAMTRQGFRPLFVPNYRVTYY
jgi:hypothetical protein